jgi:hypothetical protein
MNFMLRHSLLLNAFLGLGRLAHAQEKVDPNYFGIQVVDEATSRGVPLVELRTVNGIVHVTDSAGWVAFREPQLMDREVYFAVKSPGYEHPKDGFGFRGVRLVTKPGWTATIKVKRINVAERLYRITGAGIYRDSLLLGLKAPMPEPNLTTLGQDSVQAVPYRGKLFWLWGDTNLANYPLGNFHTTAATSPLPGKPGCRPDAGIALTYFADAKKPERPRRMVPLQVPGVVWLFGLLTVRDDAGAETLLAHFTRRKSLAEQLEHGLVRFDDAAGVFQKIRTDDLMETWRFPRGNAVRVKASDGDYFYFAAPFSHTRVRADWKALLDPNQYEALTFDAKGGSYRWQRTAAPTTQADEQQLLRAGALPENQARYELIDAVGGASITMHGASINWNDYRKKWVLIGVERGGKDAPSLLGEVWYAEADSVAGPWRKALKVASHPKYSFYNPRHHAFFDEEGGRVIYFEGTYTHTFSGNQNPTPRYDYNQLMYRFDLADERLKALR